MPNTQCRSWFTASLVLAAFLCSSAVATADEPPQKAEMAGSLFVPHSRAPKTFDAGFSMSRFAGEDRHIAERESGDAVHANQQRFLTPCGTVEVGDRPRVDSAGEFKRHPIFSHSS